jgi:antitoxin (DNA-binding transcriptional repressor) of toxin-antitoxin stability system
MKVPKIPSGGQRARSSWPYGSLVLSFLLDNLDSGLTSSLLHYSHICGNNVSEVKLMKFVGVREFKQDVVKYLNQGNEIVVMKRKKPIARLTPVQKRSAELILLEIGRILSEAGVSKKEALNALDRARREIHG